ncbi:MAG: transglutaminase family protein [Solirubrobacterales bacterium]
MSSARPMTVDDDAGQVTEVTSADLAPTEFVDSEHEAVRRFVERVAGSASDERTVISRLFAAVRDEIRYDPYSLSADPGDYRASAVIAAGSAYCVPKAVLLTASARAAGIPARLGFADVRNHLQSPRLLELMGTDLFIYHGYSSVFVGGHWRKASPAFNRELCAKFGVPALEFDGSEDALLHAFNGSGERHMEYVRDRGTTTDLPFAEIMAAYAATYSSITEDEGLNDRAVADPKMS